MKQKSFILEKSFLLVSYHSVNIANKHFIYCICHFGLGVSQNKC